MRPHYVSKWLLKEFRSLDDHGSEALYELDIATKDTARRNIDKAGSEDHFWKQDTENSMFAVDQDACKVVRNVICGKPTIAAISFEDRVTFAKWVCLTLARVPYARSLVSEAIADLKSSDDLTFFRKIVWTSPDECVEGFKADYPTMYAKIMSDQGQLLGREEVLSRVITKLVGESKRELPDPKTAHENHLGKLDREYWVLVDYLAKLCKWTLIHIPEAIRSDPLNRFVICDNPVVRWNANEPNQQIKPGAQVTIPLGNFLTLSIGWDDAPASETCSVPMLQQLNDRQLRSATTHVYSGKEELLKRIAESL